MKHFSEELVEVVVVVVVVVVAAAVWFHHEGSVLLEGSWGSEQTSLV